MSQRYDQHTKSCCSIWEQKTTHHKRKHAIVVELATEHLGHTTRIRLPKDPYVDPDHLVVRGISRRLPEISSPGYSHWSEEGYGQDSFSREIKAGHKGEWWSRGTSRYIDHPKMLSTHSIHKFNFKSPEEIEVKREKAAARKRQRVSKATKGQQSLEQSRAVSLESLDSLGPSSKKSKDESLAEDDSAPWQHVPTREEQKIERLQKELADTKQKLDIAKLPAWQRRRHQQSASATTPAATAGSSTAPSAGNRSSRFRDRQIRAQQLEDTLPYDPPRTRSQSRSASKRDDMSYKSPLDTSSIPASMNPQVELVRTFGLTPAQARYQNRPLTLPGQTPSHPPGYIHTRLEKLNKSATKQGDGPPSFAGATATPANPFPQLDSPARDKLVTDRPLSDPEKRLARGPQAPAKPADAKDAPGTKQPTQPANSENDSSWAPTTPVGAQGTRLQVRVLVPRQPSLPVAPVPMIAYGAPHNDVARIAAQSHVGYDDRIDSMHGHCAVRLQQIAAEARARVH